MPPRASTTAGLLLTAVLSAAPAIADFVVMTGVSRDFSGTPGWETQWKVTDLFAVFSDPNDEVLSVGGSDVVPTFLRTNDPSGFRNATNGTHTPPVAPLIPLSPDVQWDTFVTIGVAELNAEQILLTPGMPAVAGDDVTIPEGEGWASLTNDLGRAGNYPANQVMIARLVYRRTAGFSASVKISYLTGGRLVETIATLSSQPPEDDCNGNQIFDLVDIDAGREQDCNANAFPDSCEIAFGLEPDCNVNGIPDACDLASGESTDQDGNGIPDECESCPTDLDGNGTIDFSDLVQLLADWGVCVCDADIDGDGEVDFEDLLGILTDWGDCR